MNETIKIIIAVIVGVAAGYFLNASTQSCNQSWTPVSSSEERIAGKPDSNLVKGKTTEKSEVIPQSGKKSESVLYPSLPSGETERGVAVFEETIKTEDSEIKLSITTYPPADSIFVKYLATVKHRTFERVDTLRITQIDTLKLTEVIEEPRAFYDNFWAGSSITAILILVITFLIN